MRNRRLAEIELAFYVAHAYLAGKATEQIHHLQAHGVTKPFALPLVARWNGSEIVVATTGDGAKFLMADFGVTLPKVPVADVDDHGTIEVQVRFVPA